MTMPCICGYKLDLPHSTSEDVKCSNCGRVYNHRGQYLWREEDPTTPPGVETKFVEGPEAHGDRRNPDEIAALEEAFAEGKLPEEDRRDELDDDFGGIVKPAPAKKRATNKR